jgi:hypothetical protein
VAAHLPGGRQIGNYPETGFEEIRAQRASDETLLPRSGLLARNNFRFVRHPLRIGAKCGDHFLQADYRDLGLEDTKVRHRAVLVRA